MIPEFLGRLPVLCEPAGADKGIADADSERTEKCDPQAV